LANKNIQRTVKSAVSLRYTLLLTAVDVKRYVNFREAIMKFIVVFILLTLSSFSVADEYQWCQLKVEAAKQYYDLPVDQLLATKSKIASSSSVESLSQATGRDYGEVVSALSKENVSKEKANKFVIGFMKSFEMKNISFAISMKKLHSDHDKKADDFFWNEIFDGCVEHGKENQ